MLELGIGADLVRGFGWVFQLAFLATLALALWRGKTWRHKLFYVGLVLLVFIGPALPGMYRTFEYKQKYAKAKAVFDERCKTAGEKIYKTVEDVEGVLLLNVRTDEGSRDANRHDPNWPDAALPKEAVGDWYIRSFLSWEHQQFPPARGFLNSESTDRNGYLVYPGFVFVDVKQSDGVVYRYRFKQSSGNELSREPLTGNVTRYAVSFSNMVEPSDRANWVAGTTVTITDTLTNESVAEKTWYSFEPGLGSRAGARTPWGFAIQCPSHRGWSGGQTRMFVDQVLKPRKGV